MSSFDSGDSHSVPDAGFGFPQLAAALLIGYLIYRWYASASPSQPSSTIASRTAAPPRRLSPLDQQRYDQKAEVIHGMFPQIPMGAIRWELLQNGGSVEITTEKILANGFLREPPAEETPTASVSVSGAGPSHPSSTSRLRTPASASQPKTDAHSDLITRYNLHAKLASTQSESEEDAVASKKTGKSTAWSQNKTERQALLQKRREEMILKARRRLEEEDMKKKEAAAAASS